MTKPAPDKPNESWKKPVYKGGEPRRENSDFGKKHPPVTKPERPRRPTE